MEVEDLTSNRGIQVGDVESTTELLLLALPSSSRHRGDLWECRAELSSPTGQGPGHLSRTAPNLLSQEGELSGMNQFGPKLKPVSYSQLSIPALPSPCLPGWLWQGQSQLSLPSLPAQTCPAFPREPHGHIPLD